MNLSWTEVAVRTSVKPSAVRRIVKRAEKRAQDEDLDAKLDAPKNKLRKTSSGRQRFPPGSTESRALRELTLQNDVLFSQQYLRCGRHNA